MDIIIKSINYFLIYSFVGWVVEVVYHAVSKGVVVNRGFLNGPICPIYGFGMLLVLGLLKPVSDNLVILFIGGMLLTTSIELLGGWMLEKLFHMRWWDYSKEPYNLNGYICPKFSLAWGLGVVIALRVVHTIVSDISEFVLRTHLNIILIPLCILLIVDLSATVATILKLQDELKRLEHLAAEMREFSDKLTEVIASRALETEQKIDETRVQAALGKAEGKEYLTQRRDEIEREISERLHGIEQIKTRLHAHRIVGLGRIMHSYPHLKLTKTGQSLIETVERLTKRD